MRAITHWTRLTLLFGSLVCPLLAAEWGALGEVKELGRGITPGVCVDASGLVHVVYMAGGDILYVRGDASGSFVSPERVPSPENGARYNSPHLVCDSNGTVHLVFTRDFAANGKKAWYTNRHGGKWKTPVVAIDHTGTERRVNYPRLAVNGTTVFVAAFAARGSTLVKLCDVAAEPHVVAMAESPLWAAHPFVGEGELLVVGRYEARGHQLERFSHALAPRGERLLLSRGTPTKTFEPTAAIIDKAGVIHVAGATQSPVQILWYTTSERAAAGKDVILGPELGTNIREDSFPIVAVDARRRVYFSYRHHGTGEGRVTVLKPDSGNFAAPITFAPSITRRLRWNAPLAAAPGGGVYAVWDAEERIYFRAIGETAENEAGRD